MSGWRPLMLAAAVAATGAAGTLAAGAATGMPPRELEHLGLVLLPAVLVTAIAALLARRIFLRSSIRQSLLVVALVATSVGLANLAALAALMFISGEDATQVAILLVYSLGAGVGAALALARSSAEALDRLAATARRLAGGDLRARAGPLAAGPELATLASTLDEMASRLERSIERERAAEAQRRDLVIAVSHDLRTPLAGLRAMVEAIDDGVVDDPPSLRRYVGEMRGAVESLVALVDDLFELVQLDAGAIEAEAERVRLEDIVDSALAACDAQATEKGLQLETYFGGIGGASCSPRIARVVQNLVQNAIRHTPADGTIRVHARRGQDGIEVVVEDSGEGIPQEELTRIFDPFWRGDAARSGNGSGLGLTIAKRIVEALGGEIEVQSEPAHGSRFSVLLPEIRV